MNKIILVGNICQDINLKYLQTGSAIAKTSIAVNENYKDHKGNKQVNTCFVELVFFGRVAEIANQYLKSGSQVAINGKLNHEVWKDQQGNTKSKHNVVVETLEMLGKKQDNTQENNQYNNHIQTQDNQKQQDFKTASTIIEELEKDNQKAFNAISEKCLKVVEIQNSNETIIFFRGNELEYNIIADNWATIYKDLAIKHSLNGRIVKVEKEILKDTEAKKEVENNLSFEVENEEIPF